MTTQAVIEPETRRPKVKKLYLINRDFQLRYTKIAVLVGLCSTALTLFLVLFPLFQFQILRFPNFLPYPFLVGIALAAILNFAIVAAMGILITHRIAGPMFSLVRQLRVVQSGNFAAAHLKTRESDDLKYVVRNFNETIDFLIESATRDRAAVDAVLAKLKDCAGSGSQAALAEAIRLSEAIRGELSERLAEGATPA